MDEEIIIINEKTRNEKIRSFFIENKKLLISAITALILIILAFYSYQIYKDGQKDRAIKLKLSKLYTKAFKQMPGSPAQEKTKKEIEKLRNQLSEGVDLPIEIGDTVRKR